MRIRIFCLFLLSPLTGITQDYISNSFYTYFDLRNIKHKDFHHEIHLSLFMDELGYNGEWFIIKKNFLSINGSMVYKRMLPDMNGILWSPRTFEYASVFPLNGLLLKSGIKYYFNHRKFTFAGVSLNYGLMWTNENNWPEFAYPGGGYSLHNYKIFEVKNVRMGFDFQFGRKFINRFINEIIVVVGARADNSYIRYQCINCYNASQYATPNEKREMISMMHFSLLLGFDLKRDHFGTE